MYRILHDRAESYKPVVLNLQNILTTMNLRKFV